MALINKLRNKMGKILVGVIMITMLSFILTDLIGNSTLLGNSGVPNLAEINGKTISNIRFQEKVDELTYYFAVNTRRNPSQEEGEQIKTQAWNALIFEEIYQREFEKLGIRVMDGELVDLVQGNNISPQVIQFFSNPETGEFSKNNIVSFLSNLPQAPLEQQMSWRSFEQGLIKNRLAEKYNNLLVTTNYVNSYEAKEEYISQSARLNFEYAYVPFLSISDSSISISENELTNYITEHKYEFQREESRGIKYVAFDLIPSSEDSAIVVAEVNELYREISEVTDDSVYAKTNSEDPLPYITYTQDNLPDSLQGENEGYITTPKLVNGAYEFYKLSKAEEIENDSVVYKVAKIRREFFVSDETDNIAYRLAESFASSVSNLESFEQKMTENNFSAFSANEVEKNATNVGRFNRARALVSWIFREGKVGKVSNVISIDGHYVVAVMTKIQEKGVADLNSVRNQVERKVINLKKAELISKKLNDIETDDLSEMVNQYGTEAKFGTSEIRLSSNIISGEVGTASAAIGLANALDEEEITQSFNIPNGVIRLKLISKNIPEEIDDYSAYAGLVASKIQGTPILIADFPLSFFGIRMLKDVDETVKKFGNIEDNRYKFF